MSFRVANAQAAGPACMQEGDRLMVACIRLALALSILTSQFLGATGGKLAAATCATYVAIACMLCLLALRKPASSEPPTAAWFDVAAQAVIVALTGGSDSPYFLAFFFPILAAAFHGGFQSGAHLTLASALGFCLAGLVSQRPFDLQEVLLRTGFIAGLGYMGAWWGGANVELKRRLNLLRRVSQISNPRFGANHTIATAMESIRLHFQASACFLVIAGNEDGHASMRSLHGGAPSKALAAEPLDEGMRAVLLRQPAAGLEWFARRPWRVVAMQATSRGVGGLRWQRMPGRDAQLTAELLDTRAYISVPLRLRSGEGRFFITRSSRNFRRGDPAFLLDVVNQAFPVIETVDLLDHMASDAASLERQRLALDLHDNAVQPYIGIAMSLAAAASKAPPGSELEHELNHLRALVGETVADLRRYATRVKETRSAGAASPLTTVLQRQAAHAQRWYGLEVELELDPGLAVTDRMVAELGQLAGEGLTNVGKHTDARHAALRVKLQDQAIVLEIENEGDASGFTPASIARRAHSLGGRTEVRRIATGRTRVAVEIPV